MSVGWSSIAIGPIRETVAELVKKFAVNPEIIAIIDQLIFKEFDGRDSNKLLNFKTNHDDAPVSFIWNPKEIVAANNKITPQFVFLFNLNAS